MYWLYIDYIVLNIANDSFFFPFSLLLYNNITINMPIFGGTCHIQVAAKDLPVALFPGGSMVKERGIFDTSSDANDTPSLWYMR